MSIFLEQYGESFFVLVIIAILVTLVSPLGKMIIDAIKKLFS